MFEKLFPYLDANEQHAWERYGIICRKLITFFETKIIVDPVDCTIKTFHRVLKNIDNDKINRTPIFDKYFLDVAYYIFKETSREAPKSIEILSPPQIPVTNPEDEEDEDQKRKETEQLLDYLDHCMKELQKNDQDLIIDFYKGVGKERIKIRKNLAKKLDMTINALRIRANRLRDKLRKCLYECLGQGYAY